MGPLQTLKIPDTENLIGRMDIGQIRNPNIEIRNNMTSETEKNAFIMEATELMNIFGSILQKSQ